MRWALLAIACVGCRFPTPSDAFACTTSDQCDGRVCSNGFCVVGADAAVADTPIDMPPDADPFAQIAQQCLDVGYVFEAGPNGYYRPVNVGAQAKNWLNAQADCKDDVVNATHLIVLSSVEEVTYVDTTFANNVWIGLSDRDLEGTMATVTGEIGDQRPFNPGEPNNGDGNEDCVIMDLGGGLDDQPCGQAFRYVCECDGKTSTP